jgi:hypothetical protein
MQVQQRLVRNPTAGIVLTVAVLIAAAFTVMAFYLARPAVVSGTSTGSPSVTTIHQQAPDAAERNANLNAAHGGDGSKWDPSQHGGIEVFQ